MKIVLIVHYGKGARSLEADPKRSRMDAKVPAHLGILLTFRMKSEHVIMGYLAQIVMIN